MTANGKPDMALILNPSGFLGVDGLFRFLPSGNADRLMDVYQIAGAKRFVRKETASTSFAIEDWKKEQLQDIRIINEFEEKIQDNRQELNLENKMVNTAGDELMTPTVIPADSTSADRPLSVQSINSVH